MMGEFTLDTAGVVVVPTCDPAYIGERWMRWPDLSPFEQGYVEAALAKPLPNRLWRSVQHACRFDMLAHEALAAMLRDCAYAKRAIECSDIGVRGDSEPERGAWFWQERQRGRWRELRPLTLYLGDDGKIYLREGQS